MKCQFLKHGIALRYDQMIRPCCAWDWKTTDWNFPAENIQNWFDSEELKQARDQLESGVFPKYCASCERVESAGRGDSMRLNAESAYGHYQEGDITLEIRPGNTCNFACQTCWPEASSRVSSYHKQAFGTKDVISKRYTDFSLLDPMAHRIKDIVVLGGEPFYDKSCLAFLDWVQQKQLDANLLLFTNASVIDWDFIENYKGKFTIVVSLDAIGKVAEYIRQGTDWDVIKQNYLKLRTLDNVEVRVNITHSVYNYPFMADLIKWLAEDWPGIVTFATAHQAYLQEQVVPKDLADNIANELETVIPVIWESNIPEHQQYNTENAVREVVNNLRTRAFDESLHNHFVNHMTKLDMVKNLFGEDYDPYFEKITK